MALTKVTEPFAVFTDADGSPLDGGFIYVGTVDQNPETSPITVYYDEALSIPAAQPLRTSNGYVMRSGSPAVLYVDVDYSITVRDKNGALVIATQSNVGVSPGGALIAANNLSDVDDAAASLVNLGLTATAAELNQVDGKSVIGDDTNILTTPTITGQALKYLRVNAGETAAEFAAIPPQLQATWNTGTDTTESLISPAKLTAKILDSGLQIGVGQTWQDVLASRTHTTSYQNITGKPIMVAVGGDPNTTTRFFQVSANNSTWISVGLFVEATSIRDSVEVIVPDQWYYRVDGSFIFTFWSELR